MPVILKDLARKNPQGEKGRVRNYLVRKELGSQHSTIHENIVNPGAIVPWHTHSCEEILLILEGKARCTTPTGVTVYSPGDVMIIAENEEHTIECISDVPMRQLCFFPSETVITRWRDEEVYAGQSLAIAN